MNLLIEKKNQACEILNELNIDCWVIYVRETLAMADPALELVVGHDATWQSFFIYTRDGLSTALVGEGDADNFRKDDLFDKVLTYTEGVRQDFIKLISEIDPQSIALNYSLDDTASDGLTHGMYLQFMDCLDDTPYKDRIISSEKLISKLRSRKLDREIALIRKAAELTVKIWDSAVNKFKVGMTEIDIANILESEMQLYNVKPSFNTIVNAGDKTNPGHGNPTDAKIETGDLLHIDFGIKLEGFCSDLQRLVYFKRYDETKPPEQLMEAFNLVRDIITETGKLCKPGMKGFEIDNIARNRLIDSGFTEYQHALGHMIGRDVHDGGPIIGPKWERYGMTPAIPLEKNNTTTLELEIILPAIGCVGLEEDVCVTENGAEYLCPRQLELIVK